MRWSRPMPRATSSTSAPGLLAHVGDLVDERDLGGQKGVGGQLDHLGAGDVGAHDGRVERRVELDHGVAGPVAVVADHHPVGREEVLQRRALLEELGARDVGEPLAGRSANARLIAAPGADRHRRLHHERVAVGGRHRADDRVDARTGRRRPSRWAACPRPRTAAGRARARGASSVEKCSRSRLRGHRLGQAGLVDRDLPSLEPRRSCPRRRRRTRPRCPSSANPAAVTSPT